MQRSTIRLPEHEFIQLGVAETKEEMLDVNRLRYEVFGREFGYINHGDEEDPYDRIAFNILARKNGMPAGSIRIIDERDLNQLDGENGVLVRDGRVKFPMEKEEGLDRYRTDGRRIVELSRFVIPLHERKSQIAPALMASCFHYVMQNGVTDGFILANCEMNSRGKEDVPDNERIKVPEIFKKLGFIETRDPLYYSDFHAWAIPMHLPIERVTKTLKVVYSKMHSEGFLPDFRHRLYVVKNNGHYRG